MKNETKDLIIHLIIGTFFLIIGFVMLCSYFKDNIGHIKCIDGDTFAIGQTYYRLAYIDTGEIDEPTYVASSKYTCEYLMHNDFKLKKLGKDNYDRTLVIVNPNNLYTLNDLLVKDCLADPFWGKTTDSIMKFYNNCKVTQGK